MKQQLRATVQIQTLRPKGLIPETTPFAWLSFEPKKG